MVTKDSKDPKDKLIDWATGQSFNNIMLAAIFCCIAWFMWYALTTAIPEHLRQMQAGYEYKDEKHAEERMQIIQYYDKWLGNRNAKTDAPEIKVGQVDE